MTFFNASSDPLNADELEYLDELLLKYESKNSLPSASALDGFLTAVVSGPNMIPPSQWLPAIWGGPSEEPYWESEAEFENFMRLVTQQMNNIADILTYCPENFQCLFIEWVFDDETCVISTEWCEGYMCGVRLDEQAWLQTPEAVTADTLGVINLLAGSEPEVLESLSEDAVVRLREKVGPAAKQLHAYWLQQRMEQAPEFPPNFDPAGLFNTSMAAANMPVRNESKVGRNDPCPCGSGKKYKRCCLQ